MVTDWVSKLGWFYFLPTEILRFFLSGFQLVSVAEQSLSYQLTGLLREDAERIKYSTFSQSCGSGSAFILPPGSGSAYWIPIKSRVVNFWGKNWKNASKLVIIDCTFIFKNELHTVPSYGPVPWFLTSEQSFWSFSTLYKLIFFTNFVRLAQDPDPHLNPGPLWEKQLDPDPQKMNADPQPCFFNCNQPW